MADFLIQTIDLDKLPNQAVDYGRGLQKYMMKEVLSAEDIADIACTTPKEIHHLIAGTSDQANALARSLWIRGEIHIESMILIGSGFPGGYWADKVLAVM